MEPSIDSPPPILMPRAAHDELTVVAPEAPATTSPGARALVETMPMASGALAAELRATRNRLCAAALAKGVTLIVSNDWDDLAAVNAANRAGWYSLLPKPASAPCFWVGAVDSMGEVVATHGVVLVDCTARSFGERVTDLSLFHDPGHAPAEEWAFCASGAALETRGKVAWVVAGWTRPDWRGKGLFHLLGAVARLVAWSRFRPRWVVGLIAADTLSSWRRRGAGRVLVEEQPSIVYRQRGVDRAPIRFMRWSRAAVLLDLGPNGVRSAVSPIGVRGHSRAPRSQLHGI